MIIGQYRILEKLGEGGMGIVYRAEHMALEQNVAIKSLSDAFISDPEMHGRFVREARIQAKLSHPNIVNLFNFFEQEGKFYLVMEYVEGETLESMIKRLGQVPTELCLSIIKQVLNAFSYAHSRGIIHRDIKPGNIIISEEGQVKITDFGVAKIATDFKMTQTDIKIGTLYYMSPEYLRGEPVGPHSDIYSIGVTLYQMVTGKVPFVGDTEYKLLKAIVETEPPLPREFYPTISSILERVILKAMAKSPADRFQDAREFALALNDFELESTISHQVAGDTSPVPLLNPKKKGNTTQKVVKGFSSSRKGFWAAAAALIILGIGFFSYHHYIGFGSNSSAPNFINSDPASKKSTTTKTNKMDGLLEPSSSTIERSLEPTKELIGQPPEIKKNRGGLLNRRVERVPGTKKSEIATPSAPRLVSPEKQPADQAMRGEKMVEVPRPNMDSPPRGAPPSQPNPYGSWGSGVIKE